MLERFGWIAIALLVVLRNDDMHQRERLRCRRRFDFPRRWRANGNFPFPIQLVKPFYWKNKTSFEVFTLKRNPYDAALRVQNGGACFVVAKRLGELRGQTVVIWKQLGTRRMEHDRTLLESVVERVAIPDELHFLIWCKVVAFIDRNELQDMGQFVIDTKNREIPFFWRANSFHFRRAHLLARAHQFDVWRVFGKAGDREQLVRANRDGREMAVSGREGEPNCGLGSGLRRGRHAVECNATTGLKKSK